MCIFLGVTGYFTHIYSSESEINNQNTAQEPDVQKPEFVQSDKITENISSTKKPNGCPDAWYINKMPIISNSELNPPKEYIIKNGAKSYEINETWLREVCGMEPLIVR